MDPDMAGLNGAHGAPKKKKKNSFSKQARSGPQVLAHESGPGMEKLGLNPTRCHS